MRIANRLAVGLMVILLAASGGSASSAEPEPAPTAGGGRVTESDLIRRPSMELALRYAQEHNPAIRASRYAWRAARQRITQERSYENPMVIYSPDTQNMAETRAGPQTNTVGFSQAIPFPGKLGFRGNVADRQARAAQEQLHATAQEVARQVRTSYADFYLADRSLEVNAATTDLVRQFEAIAQARYRVAKGAQADVILAQESLSRLAAERVDFESGHNVALGNLNAQLDRPPRAPIGRPVELRAGPPKLTLAALVDEAKAARPELRAQDDVIDGKRQALFLARMGYLPDFTIGGQYTGIDGAAGSRGFNRDGHDIWMVTVGFSIPIWLDRVAARVDEAKAQVFQEQFKRRDLGNAVNDDVQNAYERLVAAAHTEAIYRTTLIPQTEERIGASRAGYQTGIVDFLTLIDSLKSFEDVRLLRYRSVRAYQQAAADLERAVGRELPEVVK